MADRYYVPGGTNLWTNTSNWSASATLTPTGASVPTSADNVFFTSATTYSVGAASSSVLSCANFTVSAGTVTFSIGSLSSISIYGDFSLLATTLISDGNANWQFAKTSGTQLITTNGVNIRAYVTFSGAATYQLQDNLLVNSTSASRNIALTSGTLDLNNKQISCIAFTSSNTNVRTIAFGTTGKIVILGGRGAGVSFLAWDTSTLTNLTITGNAVVDITSANGDTGLAQMQTGALSEANAISFNIKATTYSVAPFFSTGTSNYKNLDFTGFTQTMNAITATGTIYGNLTFSTGMSTATTSNTGSLTFAGTSGTQTITSNGKSLNVNVSINGSVILADALALNAAQAKTFTLVGGTFDGNNKSITSAGGTTFSSTGIVKIQNVSTALAFTQTSGFLIQGAANTFGAFTQTLGTLSLQSYQLNCTSFTSSNANVRSIGFGTGNITCTGTGVVWSTATTTNLTVTGTPTVNVTNATATATTVNSGILTEAQAISFNFTAGTYALTFLGTASYSAKNVNFTGFAGTWAARTVAGTIYGNLTLSTGMTFAASTGALTFGATSGTQLITTNAKTFNGPITINGVGGTVKLADALTLGTTALTLTNGTFDGDSKTISGASSFSMVTGSVTAKNISTALAFTHTSGTLTQGGNNSTGVYTIAAGTLNLAGYTLTATSFVTAAGTKNLTFNGGTLAITNATVTAFNNAVPTGFTTTAGTGTGKISMTAATAKTFVGGGSTYNCTLSNDGAGALTITGSNTFTTITNGVQPTTFTFTAATTTTVTNWLVGGTPGNLVTIGSATAATHTLSKSSGYVSTNYLSISRSTATGGAIWYAGANSTDGGNNSGWIFANGPNIGSAFFSIF